MKYTSGVDPIALFLERREAAIAAGAPFDGAAAVLATADASGAPSARMVLLKEVTAAGLFVYTNYGSRKALDLDANPRAAFVLHWVEIGEQFRFEGTVTRADAATSDRYFAGRPRASQLGAWASEQSQPIEDRGDLLRAMSDVERRFEGQPVPRPENWGGFRVDPDVVEHWVNGEHRLHDRVEYRREAGAWRSRRLAP